MQRAMNMHSGPRTLRPGRTLGPSRTSRLAAGQSLHSHRGRDPVIHMKLFPAA